jgi:hypothetical protein
MQTCAQESSKVEVQIYIYIYIYIYMYVMLGKNSIKKIHIRISMIKNIKIEDQ